VLALFNDSVPVPRAPFHFSPAASGASGARPSGRLSTARRRALMTLADALAADAEIAGGEEGERGAGLCTRKGGGGGGRA